MGSAPLPNVNSNAERRRIVEHIGGRCVRYSGMPTNSEDMGNLASLRNGEASRGADADTPRRLQLVDISFADQVPTASRPGETFM